VDSIDAHRCQFGVVLICHVLTKYGIPIAPSTFYDAVRAHAAGPSSAGQAAVAAAAAVTVWMCPGAGSRRHGVARGPRLRADVQPEGSEFKQTEPAVGLRSCDETRCFGTSLLSTATTVSPSMAAVDLDAVDHPRQPVGATTVAVGLASAIAGHRSVSATWSS
jgi:hypothetical protein